MEYKNIDNNLINEEESDEKGTANEIGYPVHVYFIDLTKRYMNHISWHWHPDIEIIIVNHGEICFLTNDSKEILSAGQGVIVNANVMHSIETSSEDANCSMYSTVFNPAFLFGYGNIALVDKYLIPITSSRSFQYQILDENSPQQAHLLDCINNVIAFNLIKNYGYEMTTKGSLCDFWVSLLELVAPFESQKESKREMSFDESRAKNMIKYIEQNYADKITLDELAKSVHISKSECCRCFKRALNMTPVEYLMKHRISVAANMIQNNDPIAFSSSNLAFHVGFNNASYFNKVFKEYLGCTPSEYRRKAKNDPNFNPFRNATL